MSRKISLTGIKPTGTPHLGNYLGAIKPAIEIANTGEFDCYYFIADYHSLTTVQNGKQYKQHVYEVAATWLSMGLDPSKVTIYKQSDIPEILELNWILSCFTAKGLMNRAHAYKALAQNNEKLGRDPDQGVNMGIYTYPILMASDILFMNADSVPVGADQVQHIEMARDMAGAFNHRYGDVLKMPEAFVNKDQALVPGLDGRKMSKSYNNYIPLFLPEKKLRKIINKITTDSLPPEAPKNPDDSLIFDLYKFIATDEQIENLKQRYLKGIGWGEAKLELFEVLNEMLKVPRAQYEDYMNNPEKIDAILRESAHKVRPKAQENLERVKRAIGAL